ncbi:MAG TPA: dihydrodipicolinate synthase family protein [Tepidisphaeraceae bacterium]|nr:dihydrodipicolinate synthase family protein [Tepidisphaeraceae bacterium]
MTSWSGVVVPMVTPFTPAGAIDEDAIARIVDHLIKFRLAGIFPLGTTGESMSIHPDDRRKVVAATVKRAGGRATVYAGIASTCFRESVEAADAYAHLGAAAAVAHIPSYYPLNDDEIESYFLRLADAGKLPLVLYNMPATTHHSIPLDAIDRLRQHPNIVAIKDSAGDRERLTELLRRCGGRGGFPVLIGASSNFSVGLRHGAVGLIPSGGHLIGDKYQAMFEAGMAQRWDDVERFQCETDAIVAAYLNGRTLGQGLAVLKAKMEKLGLCGRTMLPPLRDHVGAV